MFKGKEKCRDEEDESWVEVDPPPPPPVPPSASVSQVFKGVVLLSNRKFFENPRFFESDLFDSIRVHITTMKKETLSYERCRSNLPSRARWTRETRAAHALLCNARLCFISTSSIYSRFRERARPVAAKSPISAYGDRDLPCDHQLADSQQRHSWTRGARVLSGYPITPEIRRRAWQFPSGQSATRKRRSTRRVHFEQGPLLDCGRQRACKCHWLSPIRHVIAEFFRAECSERSRSAAAASVARRNFAEPPRRYGVPGFTDIAISSGRRRRGKGG